MKMKLAYCDHIAATIQENLNEGYDYTAGPVYWDLHPTEGYMLSTKKTLSCVDSNGRKYMITVEEL